jgi:hypothetical protein
MVLLTDKVSFVKVLENPMKCTLKPLKKFMEIWYSFVLTGTHHGGERSFNRKNVK